MPNKEKTFSIVTVCLNDVDGLRKTRQSIVSQSCDDYEWVVIDGQSTDGSVDFLQGITQEDLIWISEKDSGIFDAMNKGIEL